MTSEHNTLHTRLERLEQDNAAIKADNTQLKTQFHTAQRRLRIQATLAFFAFLAAVFLSPGNRAAIAQGYGITLASLDKRVTALETRMTAAETKNTQQDAAIAAIPQGPAGPAGPKGDKGDTGAQGPMGASPFTVNGTTVTLSGYNLQIVDGTGSTNSTSGLGNLLIGYNALRNSGNARTGSHNLILGDQNNYTSYGGLVAGYTNAISGSYAVVSGGNNNTASGEISSVSGGLSNTTSAPYAAVSGGYNNTASGNNASVSGGAGNTASGNNASVSGGVNITQSNIYGWSGGGYHSP